MQRDNMGTEENEMDSRYHLVIEKHQDTLDAILEYVRDIPAKQSHVRQLKVDICEVKFDVGVLIVDVSELSDLKGVNGQLDRIVTAD